MRWLFLDAHISGQFRFGWLPLAPSSSLCEEQGHATRFLRLLARDIQSRKRRSEWTGICVVAGPGSFTAVRTGVLYANLLARLYQLPLVGVSVKEAKDLSVLARRLNRGAIPSSSYVAPMYEAEPNITFPSP